MGDLLGYTTNGRDLHFHSCLLRSSLDPSIADRCKVQGVLSAGPSHLERSRVSHVQRTCKGRRRAKTANLNREPLAILGLCLTDPGRSPARIGVLADPLMLAPDDHTSRIQTLSPLATLLGVPLGSILFYHFACQIIVDTLYQAVYA